MTSDGCMRWILAALLSYVVIVVLADFYGGRHGKKGRPWGFAAWKAENYTARGQQWHRWVVRLALAFPVILVVLFVASALLCH